MFGRGQNSSVRRRPVAEFSAIIWTLATTESAGVNGANNSGHEPAGTSGWRCLRVQSYTTFGWDVYNDSVCVKAQITDLAISGDDGDILITLLLEPNHTHYSWRMNHPEDESAGRNWILVEIDENIRKNFPIIPDLAIGDTVKVCGEWVYDRAHDHNEIHPAHWVEILEMGNAPKK